MPDIQWDGTREFKSVLEEEHFELKCITSVGYEPPVINVIMS